MSRPSLVPMLAGMLLALVVVSPVLAHAELVASDPANKAVLSIPPTTVTVTFSEAIDPGRSRFRLVGPEGTVGTGRVADDPKVLTLDGLDLGPGAYEIQWTVASKDGHIERGKLRFTVSVPTPAPPTATPTATPTARPSASEAPIATGDPMTPTPPASPSPVIAGSTPAAVPSEPAAGSAGDVLLPIIVAVVVVAGVGASVLRRSRRA